MYADWFHSIPYVRFDGRMSQKRRQETLERFSIPVSEADAAAAFTASQSQSTRGTPGARASQPQPEQEPATSASGRPLRRARSSGAALAAEDAGDGADGDGSDFAMSAAEDDDDDDSFAEDDEDVAFVQKASAKGKGKGKAAAKSADKGKQRASAASELSELRSALNGEGNPKVGHSRNACADVDRLLADHAHFSACGRHRPQPYGEWSQVRSAVRAKRSSGCQQCLLDGPVSATPRIGPYN
jgi:hypothetical protein